MSSATAWSMLPFLLVTTAVLLWAAHMAAQPWLKERRRERLRSQPFPTAWRRILRRRVPMAARLPSDLQMRLKRHIQVFLAEKPFIGCQGQPITDEVRVTIAAQACLLLLGDAKSDYYPRLRQVLVYPDAFVAQRERAVGDGLVQEQRQPMLGESWSQGQVILSWAEAVAGAADPHDGRNVVLHEFAHQVDQDTGTADGRPWRATTALRRRWDRVMGTAFARLQQTPSAVIDSYGASDPAEFFAVVNEAFFERPRDLMAEAPEVYEELSALYRVNPVAW